MLDITAGGGSIPFEAGRLGFRTIANETQSSSRPDPSRHLRVAAEVRVGTAREHFQDSQADDFLNKSVN